MKRNKINVNRRNFLGIAAFGASAIFLPKPSFCRDLAETIQNDSLSFSEPTRNLSVVDDVDVIVCGGGPAGVSAAIASKSNRLPHEVEWKEANEKIKERADK